MFDVDRRHHRFFRTIGSSIAAFRAHAFPTFDDQPLNPLAGQQDAVVRLDETHEGVGELSGAAFRNWAPRVLVASSRVGQSPPAWRGGGGPGDKGEGRSRNNWV